MGDRLWDFCMCRIRFWFNLVRMRILLKKYSRVGEFFAEQTPFNEPGFDTHEFRRDELSSRSLGWLIEGTYKQMYDGEHSIWAIPPKGSWWEIGTNGGVTRQIEPKDIVVCITTKKYGAELERVVTIYELPSDVEDFLYISDTETEQQELVPELTA